MAAKFFTGLPLDGPDPECVKGNAEPALAMVGASGAALPKPDKDHSRTAARKTTVALGLPTVRTPDRPCDTSPLAGL